MSKILIMGLPGAGKTTLAIAIKNFLEEKNCTVQWYNADKVREITNNWDFSTKGRMNQCKIMTEMANGCESQHVICDFVAPLVEMRTMFNPDLLIWVDTIRESRYADTNAAFVQPTKYHFKVTEQNAEKWGAIIGERILTMMKYERKTFKKSS